MTTSRIVSRGKIRVDARRAVEKLREHLLVDLHHYPLEIVRAAVASGAERIDVRHDADDLWLSWDRSAMSPAVLPRLLDHVLTDASSREGRHLRLLALGVNAALGLSPAFVDVYLREEGETVCLRWTPRMLTGEGNAEVRAAGLELPPRTTRVHVQRKLGWQVLRRAALGGALPELSALAAATTDLPLPITLDGHPWERSLPRVILRVPLDVGLEARRAELQIVAGDAGTIELCEQGVRLVSYRFSPKGFAVEPHAEVAFPARVLIDALSLPTNASRSAVREDSDLLVRVIEQTDAAMMVAIAALLARTIGDGEVPKEARIEGGDETLRDALGALVCLAVGAHRRGESHGEAMQLLLEAPVLENACGERRAFADLMGALDRPIYVHRGAEALEPALAPWLSNVIWLRGRRAERALEGLVLRDAAELVGHAREGLAHRQLFLSHAAGRVAVPASHDHLVRESFEVDAGHYRGLSGEVAIRLPAQESTPSTVRIFHQRREIASRTLPRNSVPLCLDMAIAWDEEIRVRFGYDDVEDDRVLTAAIWYATQVAVLEAASIAEKQEGLGEEERAQLAAVLRAAVGTAVRAGSALGLGAEFRQIVPAEGALFAAPIWPTTDDRFESLASLRAELGRRSAIMVAGPKIRGRASDGRPVIAVEGPQRTWLCEALGAAPLVPYDRALVERLDAMDAARAVLRRELEQQRIEATAILAFERPGARGVIAAAREPRLVELHAGHGLGAGPLASTLAPVILVLDDDALVPNATWNGVRDRGSAWTTGDVERQLLEHVVNAFGETRPKDDAFLRAYLIVAATTIRDGLHVDDAGLLDRLCDLPLVRALDEDGCEVRISLARLDALHPPPRLVPVLDEAPGFETLDWWPVLVADKHERRALASYGAGLSAGRPDLAARFEKAKHARARREVRARPMVDPFQLGTLAPMDAVTGRCQEGDDTAIVALPPAVVDPPHAVADVTFLGHPVGRFVLEGGPPVVARLGLSDESAFEGMKSLSGPGLRRAQSLLTQAGLALAEASLSPTRPMGDPRLTLLLSFLVQAAPHGPIRTAVLREAHFLRAQGGEAPLWQMERSQQVLFATQLFVPWAKGKHVDLDGPVLYLPSDHGGALTRRLLEAVGRKLRDVTAAMVALQTRRGGERRDAPGLEGEPAHPGLRRSLSDLRVGTIEGELELALGGVSRVIVLDLDGPPRNVAIDLPCAVRAMVHTGALRSHDETLRIVLRRALRKLCEQLPDLETLPREVLAARRAVLLDALEHGEQARAPERRAAIFEDIHGKLHTLASLGERVEGTTLPPPYPDLDDERVVLRWSEREREALGRIVAVDDVTSDILRVREAAQRRCAPRREAAIDRGLATLARRSIAFDDLTGEVAVLAPEAVSSRGIAVLSEGRPLCRLDDGEGWPVVAAVDTRAEPNHFFDAIAADEAARIAGRVREVATELIRSFVAAPPDAIAQVSLDTSGADVLVFGSLWLPATLAREPSITIYTAGGRVGVTSRSSLDATRFDPVIPVAGKLLLLAPDGAQARKVLDDLALEHFGAMVERLDHPAYQWQAALLSAPGHALLSAPTADGGLVDIQQVLHEIDTRGEIWVSNRRGSAEGDFPDEAPPFVLLEEPQSPLLEVLRLRARGELLRELGGPGEEAPEEAPAATRSGTTGRWATGSDACPRPPPRAIDRATLVATTRDVAPAPARIVEPEKERSTEARRDAAPEEVEHVDGWLDGLVRHVVSMFRELPEAPPGGVGLRDRLFDALRGLNLQGDPVVDVVFAKSGRPIRYDRDTRRIVLHRTHELVLALAPHDEPSNDAVEALVAAALSEINGAERNVTAAEERRALLAMLRAALGEHGD
jgi:hypothetical protein